MVAPLLAWGGLLLAMIYLPMTEDRTSWHRSVIKGLPLVFFATAAWVVGSPAFLVAGLALSAMGDFALSRIGQSAFLYGLSAFALAHLLYTIHFLTSADAALWEAFITNAPMAIFLVAYGLLAEIWLIPYTMQMRWPVRIYIALITLMGLAALTQPMGMLFVGVGFFIASDTLLAFQLFRMEEENPLIGRLGWAVWISYVAGQALIMSAG